jgi:hypothetical protein
MMFDYNGTQWLDRGDIGFAGPGRTAPGSRTERFNFSPLGATEAIEEHVVQLEDVSAIQLRMVPSIDGRRAVARVDGPWLACEVL